jgi:catechol 2,3-dioxygenase-like lactoylglutathione lyase family enzyme
MSALRMHHVGIVVRDLAAAVEFFGELGLELEGESTVEGELVDRVIGLDGAASKIAMLATPDGANRLELTEFRSPPVRDGDPGAPSNTTGLRHLCFQVEGIDDLVARLEARGATLVGELVRYGDSYRLCYLHGPEGMLVELAEEIA